ncbi:MAG: hypothetical protein N4A38_00695 [Candidatus Gracilibacteria bacterium]|nr:hypothetical protein [Candidatus Gracilibacteria bacterium]
MSLEEKIIQFLNEVGQGEYINKVHLVNRIYHYLDFPPKGKIIKELNKLIELGRISIVSSIGGTISEVLVNN